MPELIEIAFKGNRKEFFFWDEAATPSVKTPVIVDADRGEDLGRVHAIGELAKLRCEKCTHGLGTAEPSRKVLRLASKEDIRRERELRAQDEEARRKAMEHVRAHGLVMKLTDAEWQWDRRKLTLYFTAEKRVDFRKLVRDLASTFRARIELKQIGVRDEAKRLDGIGRCGRQYCSASWLPELRPVNLGVAKDQRLSLNPSQISGACGRLMCCLRYEHDFYVQSRKRFPKEGKVVVTSIGEEKVLANDIFRDRVTLKNGEGDVRIIALLELRAEIDAVQREAAGGVPPHGAEPASAGAEDWKHLSARVLPLVLGDTSDVSDADAEEGTAEDEDVDAVLDHESSAAGEHEGGSADKPRRRRGRRGGRRGKKRGQGGEPPGPNEPTKPDGGS